MKKLDYVGRRFGMMTVIEPVGKREYKHQTYTVFKCQCDCGNYFEATSHAIKKGFGQSCGCDRVYRTDQFKIMGGTNVSQMTKNTVRSNNRSGTPGVCFLTKKNRWKAELTFQGKKYYLGLHSTKEAAIKARENAYDSIVRPTLEKMKED